MHDEVVSLLSYGYFGCLTFLVNDLLMVASFVFLLEGVNLFTFATFISFGE